jgi:hypothetical protein
MISGKKRIFYILLFVFITLAGYAQDTIHLKPYISNLKSVEVFINNEKYDFLFDSGGGETFISPGVVKLLDKEIYGAATGLRMDGEMIKYQKAESVSLKMGNTEIFHQTIGVWDIMDILPEELPRIDGVISLKSFKNEILTIDLANNILVIENKASAKKQIKTKSLLPGRFANGPDGSELNIFIGLPKYGNLYWFLFDTGNMSPVILSPESAALWGLQSNTGNPDKPLSKLEFVLGKNKIETNAYSKKIIYDGALNFETISKYVFTIDFRKEEVWVGERAKDK